MRTCENAVCARKRTPRSQLLGMTNAKIFVSRAVLPQANFHTAVILHRHGSGRKRMLVFRLESQ